jgi:hypothetical protein
VSGWAEWSRNLDALCPVYERPPGACGMVSDAELCFAETWARYSFTGEGKIVELGCWLGAVTLALARGVAANPNAQRKRPIESFDRFRWEPWMTPIAERLGCARVADGESFFHLAGANIAPYAGLVNLRQKDLLEPFRFSQAIEFLFVDAMKSWDLAHAIVRTFFPKLIPGRSLLVHQDFGYFGPIVATNHILMWLLRDRCMPVYHVPGSCSVVFFVTGPLERRELPELSAEAVTPDMAEAAWAYSMGIVRPEGRRDVWLCKVLFFIEQGWLDRALEEAQRFVSTTGPVWGPAAAEVRYVITRFSGQEEAAANRQQTSEIERLLCSA